MLLEISSLLCSRVSDKRTSDLPPLVKIPLQAFRHHTSSADGNHGVAILLDE